MVDVGADILESGQNGGVAGCKDVGGHPGDDVHRPEDDVLALVGRVFLHPFGHPGGLVTATLDVDIDGGEGRGGHVAEHLVVVHSDDGDLGRNLHAADVTGLQENAGLVIIAGEDGDGLRQVLDPVDQFVRLIAPEIVDALAVVLIEAVAEAGLLDPVAETLAALFRPAYAVEAEEAEMLETAGQEAAGRHLAGLFIVGGDVGDAVEFGDVILGDGDDAAVAEHADVVVGLELADDDVGTPALGVIQHTLHAQLFLVGRRHLADHPLFGLLCVMENPLQQSVSELLSKIGNEQQTHDCWPFYVLF